MSSRKRSWVSPSWTNEDMDKYVGATRRRRHSQIEESYSSCYPQSNKAEVCRIPYSYLQPHKARKSLAWNLGRDNSASDYCCSFHDPFMIAVKPRGDDFVFSTEVVRPHCFFCGKDGHEEDRCWDKSLLPHVASAQRYRCMVELGVHWTMNLIDEVSLRFNWS